jgi:hypothetical protein
MFWRGVLLATLRIEQQFESEARRLRISASSVSSCESKSTIRELRFGYSAAMIVIAVAMKFRRLNKNVTSLKIDMRPAQPQRFLIACATECQ